jgi:CheY-like chemotaxis protein
VVPLPIDGPREESLMPTALIVEDEPEANRLLSMLVQLRGCRTESAFTGGEALDKVGQRPPDIVFLDLMLPDINGYEVCKRLKSRRATSLIPVIVVTARVAAENRVESFRAGADDYIPKPYTPEQIFQAMSKALSWHGRTCESTVEGLIPIAPAGEDELLRLLGQLRNVLLARTTLDLDAISSLASAVREIAEDAMNWARRSHHPLDTALGFHVEPDHLAITLRDSSGWLAENCFDPCDRWPVSFSAARFDDVVIEDPGHRMTFHKRYLPSELPCPA